MSEDYQQFLTKLLGAIPEVKAALILDINANIIASAVFKDLENKIDIIVISTGVAYLSILKLIDHFNLDVFDQFYVKGSDGYLIIVRIDKTRLLLARTTREIRFGLIMLDLRRTAEKISEIPYSMPKRKISLKEKLEEIEDEIQEKYKFFFSYAMSDSRSFR